MEEKLCKKCGHLKPTTEFHVNDKINGYLNSKCKPCVRVHSKKNYYENKEYFQEYVRQEKYKQYQKGYYIENKVEILDYHKKHYYETKQN